MGVTENDNENTWTLIQDFLKTNINVEIDDREIIATNRIPGKRGKPRPIIFKVLNTNSKSKIMRKTSVIRKKTTRNQTGGRCYQTKLGAHHQSNQPR